MRADAGDGRSGPGAARLPAHQQLVEASWRWRPTPLYTQLEEADLTNAYDRWNIIFGPWVYDSTYIDPWYTRSPMAGFRIGAYRTQEFMGGGYVAYRSNDRNVVAGIDAFWDHVLLPNVQIGLNLERA